MGSRILGRGRGASEEWEPHGGKKERRPVTGSHGEVAGEYTSAHECWQTSLPCDLWPETKVAWELGVRVPTTVWAMGYRGSSCSLGKPDGQNRFLVQQAARPWKGGGRAQPRLPPLGACDLPFMALGSRERSELTGGAFCPWALFSGASPRPTPSARGWPPAAPLPTAAQLQGWPPEGRPGRPSLVCCPLKISAFSMP